MTNLIFGIITILLASAFYHQAWRAYSGDKSQKALLFILLGGLSLLIFSGTDLFLHPWDERYHALVSKNLIENPLKPVLYVNPVLEYDYQNWTGNHVWLHKQPLPLWIMALSLKIFGINEISVRIPSIIFSLISIILTYRVGKYFFNEKTGLLAAFFISINGLIVEIAGGRIATDHIDLAFLFFVLVGINFSIKHITTQKKSHLILTGVSIGCAVLTKWLAGLIVIPIWLVLYNQNGIHFKNTLIGTLIISSTAALIATPWQLYIHSNFPLEAAYEAEFNIRHFTEVIEGRYGGIFYFIHKIGVNYGELIYLPIIWIIWQTWKSKQIKSLALLLWFGIPLLIFSLAKTKMQGYLLFTAPALFIISAAFILRLFHYQTRRNLTIIKNILLIALLFLPIRYSIERSKALELRERLPAWSASLKFSFIKQKEKTVLFNYKHYVEAMFYEDIIAYPFEPNSNQLQELIDKGFSILINNPKKPEKYNGKNRVQITRLND